MPVGVKVKVGVLVGVDVLVGVGEGVNDPVSVGVAEPVGVAEGIKVPVGVDVKVLVSVKVGVNVEVYPAQLVAVGTGGTGVAVAAGLVGLLEQAKGNTVNPTAMIKIKIFRFIRLLHLFASLR